MISKASVLLGKLNERINIEWHKPDDSERESIINGSYAKLISNKIPTDIDEDDTDGIFIIIELEDAVEINFATKNTMFSTIDYSGRSWREVADEWEAPDMITDDYLQEEGFRRW